jgi:RNA polymerase sigma factor (sigma-70 family)
VPERRDPVEDEREAERANRIAWLVQVLSRLDDEERELLVRHYFHGEKFSDMARALRIPANTLIQRHVRLLRRLREMHALTSEENIGHFFPLARSMEAE